MCPDIDADGNVLKSLEEDFDLGGFVVPIGNVGRRKLKSKGRRLWRYECQG